MHEVSRFYGITIFLYPREHPPAHFHALYGDDEAVFDIATLRILQGSLPNRARSMVLDWARNIVMNFLLRGKISVLGRLPAKLPPSNNNI